MPGGDSSRFLQFFVSVVGPGCSLTSRDKVKLSCFPFCLDLFFLLLNRERQLVAIFQLVHAVLEQYILESRTRVYPASTDFRFCPAKRRIKKTDQVCDATVVIEINKRGLSVEKSFM